MKQAMIFLSLLPLACCGPSNTKQSLSAPTSNQTSQTPKPKNPEPKQIDARAQALLKHQQDNFPRILNELNTNGKKTSHWIWWVFPTEMPGASEPAPKSSVDMNNLDDVLANANLASWTEILEKIALLLEKTTLAQKNRPNPAIIPSIDHGRIGYALDFWLGKAREKIKAHPRFLQAFENLAKYQWK